MLILFARSSNSPRVVKTPGCAVNFVYAPATIDQFDYVVQFGWCYEDSGMLHGACVGTGKGGISA